MLKILGQSDKFQSLNWFESIMNKLDKDLVSAEDREQKYAEEVHNMNMAYEDQKLDSEMSKRRISKLKREYEMLSFCYSASSILFKEI